jgi:hypothetical protein
LILVLDAVATAFVTANLSQTTVLQIAVLDGVAARFIMRGSRQAVIFQISIFNGIALTGVSPGKGRKQYCQANQIHMYFHHCSLLVFKIEAVLTTFFPKANAKF